ncbi:MAG TPA: serine hydrolase domain-containing protein [Pseudonocardiaceae bacterium]
MDIEYVFHRFRRLVDEHCIPAAQLAVRHAGNTWEIEFGETEHRGGTPITRDSKIPIGSITKTFTATLAMALVSDGDLELDAPLVDHLPDLRHAPRSLHSRLTLRHLLSHTGGLPSDAGDVRAASLQRHVADCCRALEPVHLPGAGFSYSNVGYVLAGRLVEVVTGMSWWEAMHSILLAPLGISPGFVVGPADAPGNGTPIVTGHAVNTVLERVRPVHQSLAEAEAPAGAVAASAADLVAFGQLHVRDNADPDRRAPRLMDRRAVLEMHRPVPDAEPFGMADAWGLGLALYRDGTTTWVGHDGTGDGTACHLRINPESGTVVALTTSGSTGTAMWRALVDDFRRAGLPLAGYQGPPRRTRRTPPPPGCTGAYFNGGTEYLVAPAHGREMQLTVDGESYGELTTYEGLYFSMRDEDTGLDDHTGRFLTDPGTGRIGWIQVGGRLARRDRERVIA